MEKYISVLIVDQSLKDQAGILTNAALVLGLTAGRELPKETFGWDVMDGNNQKHTYLTRIAHYVRKASQGKIRSIRNNYLHNPDVKIVDYTEDAAPSDYTTYSENLAQHKDEEISYRALYIYGPESEIVSATKSLSRL